MLKAKVKNTVIFGLSDMNLQKLKEGRPIMLNLSELGLSDQPIIIFNGKDEEATKEELLSTMENK